ncbi:hypothetical protein OROHE_010066 [Orobanche hederae]
MGKRRILGIDDVVDEQEYDDQFNETPPSPFDIPITTQPMADDGEAEGSQHSEQISGNSKKRGRGPAKGLKSKPGVVREIAFDKKVRPIGPQVNPYKKYLGHIARTKVSILIENWEDVPQGIKDSLWLDAQKEFNIEDNPLLKKEVLKKCNSRWRKFKSKLKEKHIDKQPKSPAYVTYKAFISKDDWNEFVKLRTSTKAVSASQKAKECREKNVHNHRMGQQAYAQKEEIWKSEGRYSNTSSSGTASATSGMEGSPDRAETWLLARSKPDEQGNLIVPNPETQKVADAMDVWKQKANDGEFVPTRSDDILARALGTIEQPGHVRGVGGAFGHMTYWGPFARQYGNVTPPVDMNAFKAELKNEIMVDILADLRKQGLQPIPKSPSQVTPTPIVPNKSSCQSGGLDPFINLKGQHRCKLAIMIGTKVVYVAEVFEGYEDKPLPAARPYVKTIGQAFGTSVEWQKHLVFLHNSDDDVAMTPKEQGNPRVDSCGRLTIGSYG